MEPVSDQDQQEKTQQSLREIQGYFQQIFEYGSSLASSKTEEITLKKVVDKADAVLGNLLKKFGDIYKSLSNELDLSREKFGHTDQTKNLTGIFNEPNMKDFDEKLFEISAVIAYLSFSIIDTNKDNMISLNEILATYHSSKKNLLSSNKGNYMSDHEIEKWFNAYDKNKNGGLEIEDYVFMTFDYNASVFDGFYQEVKGVILDRQFSNNTAVAVAVVDPDTELGDDVSMPA